MLSSKVCMCGTRLSIASHRIGRRFFPRPGTIRWSLNRAFNASHPMYSPLALSIVEGGLPVRVQAADYPYSREVSLELTVRVRQQCSRKPAPSGCLALFDTPKNRSEQINLPRLLHFHPRSCRLCPCMSLQTHCDTAARIILFIGDCMAWREIRRKACVGVFKHQRR